MLLACETSIVYELCLSHEREPRRGKYRAIFHNNIPLRAHPGQESVSTLTYRKCEYVSCSKLCLYDPCLKALFAKRHQPSNIPLLGCKHTLDHLYSPLTVISWLSAGSDPAVKWASWQRVARRSQQNDMHVSKQVHMLCCMTVCATQLVSAKKQEQNNKSKEAGYICLFRDKMWILMYHPMIGWCARLSWLPKENITSIREESTMQSIASHLEALDVQMWTLRLWHTVDHHTELQKAPADWTSSFSVIIHVKFVLCKNQIPVGYNIIQQLDRWLGHCMHVYHSFNSILSHSLWIDKKNPIEKLPCRHGSLRGGRG